MIRGFAHLCFTVSDLEASLRFYRDTLGLREAFDFINEQGELYGVYLHAGGRNFIELFEGQLADKASGQSYEHFCLEVDDIRAAADALNAAGIELGEIRRGMDHSWQVWLKDPDGNEIELHEYTDESWQTPHLA